MTVVVWMGIIFYLSSIPDLHSSLQPTWDFILRKIAHALEYGVLGIFVTSAVRPSSRVTGRAMMIGIVVASLYAMTDEYHQSFVIGRHGSPIDWLIDATGAVVLTVTWGKLASRRLDAIHPES